MDDAERRAIFDKLLNRDLTSHKYDFGHILIVGGSEGMIGAPLLAGLAALRSGAGMVTIASPMAEQLSSDILEIMTLHLSMDDAEAIRTIINFIARRNVSVITIGSGMPASQAGFIRQLASLIDQPIVLDAGGITAFEDHLDELRRISKHNSRLVLTPHAGEFERVSGQAVPDEQTAKKTLVSSFAQDHQVTLLLKGNPSLISSWLGDIAENQTGNPGMATAGTGDALTGIVAALLGQKLDIYAASRIGAFLHGLAGDLAAKQLSQPGMITTDLIKELPTAWQLAATA